MLPYSHSAASDEGLAGPWETPSGSLPDVRVRPVSWKAVPGTQLSPHSLLIAHCVCHTAH